MWKRISPILILLIAVVSCAPEIRVINGTETQISKYPYMVSIREESGSHFCGGTIIRPSWILTAAHCVDGRRVETITLQYSSTAISPDGLNVVRIKRILVHEDYDPISLYANDIALLELYGQFVYNHKTLAPVKLPKQSSELPQVEGGIRGILIGWGRNDTEGSMQMRLQEVEMKIYSDAECLAHFEGNSTAHQMCGGSDEGNRGHCNGDSGGPLLYNGDTQLGIVSGGLESCIGPNTNLGVYTKVSHYINWINSYTG